MRFGMYARQKMGQFRETLSEGAKSPTDDKGQRHAHLIAHGYEEENLFPSLRGVNGAKNFFRERGIKWWTNSRSGDRKLSDDYAGPTRNLASSQVCCVNFLLPLASVDGALLEFLKCIDNEICEIETIVDQNGHQSTIEFEWVGWDKPLEGGKITRGANQTSIDAFIVGRTGNGLRRAYLIEWKYCEEYLRPENKGLGRPGDTRRSRYTELFNSPESLFKAESNLDDFFFEPFYQIMRMHLLAHKMMKCGVTPLLPIDDAHIVVVCPEGNLDYRSIYRSIVNPLPLANRFPQLIDIESIVRACLNSPNKFTIIGQECIVSHLRSVLPVSLKSWLDYHQIRYGW